MRRIAPVQATALARIALAEPGWGRQRDRVAASQPSVPGPIVVFDGHCVLCSANARFVLRHDRRGHFRLAAMQGEVGADLFRQHGIDPADPETLIVVDGERVWRNSDAVLAIWVGLGWPWRGLALFRMVPRALRDPLYRWVARNRYRWFGRRETCWVPVTEWRERLL